MSNTGCGRDPGAEGGRTSAIRQLYRALAELRDAIKANQAEFLLEPWAFDNRIGTFAVAEAARLLAESGRKFNPEICAVSNIMEETGLFGARQIAYTLKPDEKYARATRLLFEDLMRLVQRNPHGYWPTWSFNPKADKFDTVYNPVGYERGMTISRAGSS